MSELRTALRMYWLQTHVAPKSKVREWNALCETFYRSRRAHRFGQQKRRVRRIHDLEREIVRLESLPDNNGRADAVKHLRKQLESNCVPNIRFEFARVARPTRKSEASLLAARTRLTRDVAPHSK